MKPVLPPSAVAAAVDAAADEAVPGRTCRPEPERAPMPAPAREPDQAADVLPAPSNPGGTTTPSVPTSASATHRSPRSTTTSSNAVAAALGKDGPQVATSCAST